MWLFGLKFVNKKGEGMFPSFWWDAAAHQPEVTALAAAAPCVNHRGFVPNPKGAAACAPNGQPGAFSSNLLLLTP